MPDTVPAGVQEPRNGFRLTLKAAVFQGPGSSPGLLSRPGPIRERSLRPALLRGGAPRGWGA